MSRERFPTSHFPSANTSAIKEDIRPGKVPCALDVLDDYSLAGGPKNVSVECAKKACHFAGFIDEDLLTAQETSAYCESENQKTASMAAIFPTENSLF